MKKYPDYSKTPTGKFSKHKARAKQDNIEFKFTFEQWWDIWQQSGHWENRGKCKGQYCMSRYGDLGAYEIGNVFIQLTTQNTKDAHCGKASWNKNIPMDTKVKDKISRKLKGKPNPKNKGKIPWNKGLTKEDAPSLINGGRPKLIS